MFRWVLLLLLVWFGSSASAVAGEVSQRDWMEQLIDSLGWGYGLPDDPVAKDYIALLSGERNLHVEVEGNTRRSDLVAVKSLTNYGQFSGSGWVSAGREPVQLHLDVLVQRNGRYRVSAATRLSGVSLTLAGQEFTASASENLTYQELGEVNLVAGQTEIVVSLPANAGIDYLRLSASPLPAIAPINGWQPDLPLATEDLALTMLQSLGLLVTLPEAGQVRKVEAESAALQNGVSLTREGHLGAPSGNRWVRAGHLPSKLQLPLNVQQAGCYQLTLRGSSAAPVKVVLPGILETQVDFGEALTSHSLGRYCLPQGEVQFEFGLPPWAGIDSLELHVLDIRQPIVTRLLGLSPRQRGVEREVANDLLQLLSSLTH